MAAHSANSIAAAVEQMTASIEQVGGHALEAQRIAEASEAASRQGGEIVHGAATEMRQISETVGGSASHIHELESYSAEITTIVNVIKDIADQTNMLALNAAIEAARAGEQGRGFAVVADEVRKLAERTGQSTKQIGTMISRIQDGAQRAAAEMQSSVERVERGVQSAYAAGDSITNIQNHAHHVGDSIDSIAAALREQNSAMHDIAGNVENIAHMCETNSEVISQTSALARDLARMAETLNRDGGRFKF